VRPLDFLSSIKLKLGAVIAAAVAVTVLVVAIGVHYGIPIIVLAVTAGVLALLMVQVLTRGMVSPLREMAEASKAMSRGDYDRRVHATSRDEVGDLARAFNAMAADLAEVDRIRRDLIANVSHELRTPITALRAALENLVDEVERPDPQLLHTMLGQVERLGRLVTQLLDLSRLEAGVVPLQKERFEMRPLLEQAVNEAKLQTGNGIRFAVDAAPDLSIDADAERVHQVIANLLENAVRHSPSDGHIVASARRVADRLQIEVSDEGPGIPPSEAERVFERFYRADAARARTDGGSGLGLAIARWIVDMHGGDIRAAQQEPHGCRMIVTLPEHAA
jgi:signal transduction histidine kinase